MKSSIVKVFKKEMRETFRDKKSLAMMLIIPFMIPLLVLGMSALFESEMNKPIEEYNKIGFNYEMTKEEEAILDNLKIEKTIKEEKELISLYDKNEIDLYVTKDGTTYTIHGKENEITSYASSLVESYFNIYKEYLQKEYLHKNNGNEEVLHIINLTQDIKEDENFFASYITSYAFIFIIMAITVSATYPATDATAGEKERGTLETLLTLPIHSKDIIIGKFLSVSVSSMITGIISLLLTNLSLLIASNTFEIYKDMNLMLSTTSLVFAIVVVITYSFLISGLCIAISSHSKSFKEAQSALTPLTFISCFPGMIAFMMNLKSTLLISCIPFVNFTLIFTDINNGIMNYSHIFLMILSTMIIIGMVLFIIIKEYKSEKVLFSN